MTETIFKYVCETTPDHINGIITVFIAQKRANEQYWDLVDLQISIFFSTGKIFEFYLGRSYFFCFGEVRVLPINTRHAEIEIWLNTQAPTREYYPIELINGIWGLADLFSNYYFTPSEQIEYILQKNSFLPGGEYPEFTIPEATPEEIIGVLDQSNRDASSTRNPLLRISFEGGWVTAGDKYHIDMYAHLMEEPKFARPFAQIDLMLTPQSYVKIVCDFPKIKAYDWAFHYLDYLASRLIGSTYRTELSPDISNQENATEKEALNQVGEKEAAAIPIKGKTGPRRHSDEERKRALEAWERLDRDASPITLSEFLDNRFGNTGGVPNVANSTFYAWKSKFAKKSRRNSRGIS